jgi:peptide/nickel transport system ATP-binding protein
MDDSDAVKIHVKQLTKRYPVSDRQFTKRSGSVTAIDNVDLKIMEGETLGLVGESGCGKSTLGRIIMRLVEPTQGQIWFRHHDALVDITKLARKDLNLVRRNMNMVFQDPVSSLNPRMNVRGIIAEPLILHKIAKGRELDDRVSSLLHSVGLRSEHMHRFPHAFSGGQRQRIAIARALALGPSFMVCDEPTSALDVSIQGEILNLLVRLQREIKLTSLFISHNISVVRHVSDRIAVMYLGRIVEIGKATEVCASPRHPYTEALLSAVLVPHRGRKKERIILKGSVPSPAQLPPGCGFSTRCPYREEVCVQAQPPLKGTVVGNGRLSACHFADELSLGGV